MSDQRTYIGECEPILQEYVTNTTRDTVDFSHLESRGETGIRKNVDVSCERDRSLFKDIQGRVEPTIAGISKNEYIIETCYFTVSAEVGRSQGAHDVMYRSKFYMSLGIIFTK